MRFLLNAKLAIFLSGFGVGVFFTPLTACASAEIDFLVGKVTLRHVDGRSEPELKKGTRLTQGDMLETDSNAHVYLRADDGSFLIIRPESKLFFEVYQFDPHHPDNTRIRIHLLSGVYRSITGKGLEQSKQYYRLNTPLAAIGVRGTDYTVYATANALNVTVASGGVIASLYDGDCIVSAYGGCNSGAVLMADEGKYKMLTLNMGDVGLQKVDRAVIKEPDVMAPPLPLEKERVSSVNTSIKASSYLYWGRWGALSKDDSSANVSELLQKGQLVGFNEGYGIARSQVPIYLPQVGSANFNLQSAEAVSIDASGAYNSGLSVVDAKLSVNFAHQTFDTALGLVSGSERTNFHASGSVMSDGRLVASHANSSGALAGALAGSNGEQAGYVFRQPMPNNATALGITQWGR